MRCLLLLFVLLGGLSCAKDQPPTAPAGKSTSGDFADLFDLFDALQEAEEDTAADSTASSSPDSSVASPDSSVVSPDSSVFSPTAAVDIPDIGLRRYLEWVLKKRRGATITHADMRAIVSLLTPQISEGRLRNIPIKSLVGLEAATNLQNMAIFGSFSDLTPLANLSKLSYLYFRGNKISDLTPLVNLPKLRFLDLRGNSPLNDIDLNEHVPALRRRGVEVLLSPYENTFPDSPFDIELVFLDDFTEDEQEVWRRAARRWEAAIQMNFPGYTYPYDWDFLCGDQPISVSVGDHRDALQINMTKFESLSSGYLAYAAPATSGSRSIPIGGCIGVKEGLGDLHNIWHIALHEIGHVLGIGSMWDEGGLLRNEGTPDVHFAGPQAIAAFDQAGGTHYQGPKVPLEQDESHWRWSVLSGELMSGGVPFTALSAITLGALSDIGYTVDFSAADPYELPPPGAAKPVANAVSFCGFGMHLPVYVDD